MVEAFGCVVTVVDEILAEASPNRLVFTHPLTLDFCIIIDHLCGDVSRVDQYRFVRFGGVCELRGFGGRDGQLVGYQFDRAESGAWECER